MAVTSFGAAYMLVIAIEPLADLVVLAAAKMARRFSDSSLLERRLFYI